jgi:hypothetical protein
VESADHVRLGDGEIVLLPIGIDANFKHGVPVVSLLEVSTRVPKDRRLKNYYAWNTSFNTLHCHSPGANYKPASSCKIARRYSP